MPFIETIPESEASGEVAALYEKARATYGHVPNMVRVFSLRPELNAAWAGLLGAIRARMDPRRYELATLAAAKALTSSYCALAHGTVLIELGLSEAELLAIAADHRRAGLDPVEVAIMDLAALVARDATSVTGADTARLRGLGLTDGEICDVVAAAAARCFFSKFLDALGAAPDPTYAGLGPELVAALSVGRPIDPAPPA